MRHLTHALTAAAILAATALAQSTIVIPNGFATTEAPSSTAYPWGRGAAPAGQIRVQYVYDSTHFTLQGVNTPVLISRLRWRCNTLAVNPGGTYSLVTVQMSTCPVDQAAVTTTFANNHGANLATVHAGPVTVLAGAGTTPNNWYVDIPLATPFLYDPSAGDLNIDTMTDATGWVGAIGPALDCATTGSLVSRIYNLTTYTSLTGTVQQAVGPVVEVSYNPAAGLYAGFTANVTRGATPLAVQFTDTSYSSAVGGVTSWAWDFNGDSVVDSTLQNPLYTYNTCGNYNVSLTVTDASHSPNTLTRNGYVQTDLITANFTDQLIAALTVQFTDTSNMAATTWAWDLNGDTVIDSTVQNPVFVYPNTNPVNVTLTVTRLCSPASTVTRSVTAAQQLPTNLTANNGGASLWTVLFDVNVLNPRGVNINAFDVITSSVSLPFTLDVYLKPGAYLGSEFTPSAWTQVGTASGTSNATANLPSNATLPAPLYIPAGSYGMALRYIGIVPRYMTLTAITTVGNGDLSLSLGAATVTTTAAFSGTTINTPRGWSGTIYYGTHNITSAAGYGFFAPGCPGTLGVPGNTASALPRLGMTMTANLSRLNMNAAFMIVGFSRTTSVVGPLPFNLTPFGAPGCFGRVSPDSVVLLIGAGNTATYNLAVPNNPIYLSMQLYTQGLALDTGVNVLGAVATDAAGFIVGQ